MVAAAATADKLIFYDSGEIAVPARSMHIVGMKMQLLLSCMQLIRQRHLLQVLAHTRKGVFVQHWLLQCKPSGLSCTVVVACRSK